MSIPTRSELIERARHQELDSDAGQVTPEIVADFALAEIRRALIDELEALRKWIGPPDPDWPYALQEQHERHVEWIDARLAALRADEHEQPPVVQRTGTSCAPSEPVDPRSGLGQNLERAGSTPAPGATNKPGAESQAPLVRSSERAEGRAASSPCPPSASSDFTKSWQIASPVHPLNVVSIPKLALFEQRPPMSDADVLERAAEIMDRMGSREATPEELRSDAAKLRAPKPDVFRAFFESACAAQDAAKGSWNVGDHAREWFGSTVAYVQTMAARPCVQPGKDCGFCDSCEARLDVAHLRQRAGDVSRGE